jgi:DNA-directed RNA polymerase specialized sigma24 family protein
VTTISASDPRPRLTVWLRNHWPPVMVRRAPWLRPLARWHQFHHGPDGFESSCLLAAVEAWDWWQPHRGEFERFVLLVARSRLWAEVKYLRQPPAHLEGWDVIDRDDPALAVETRDAAAAVRRLAPHAADTLAAVAIEPTIVAAAKRLGVSRETVRVRLRAVRIEIGERIGYAETDLDETSRSDVIHPH